MRSLQERLQESLQIGAQPLEEAQEYKDNSTFYKLCQQLNDDEWNPWRIVNICHRDKHFDYEEATANAAAEAADVFGGDEEEAIRNFIDSKNYDKIIDALDDWDDPARDYIQALIEEFENLI